MSPAAQLINDVRLIDGTGTAAAPGRSVVIENGAISWIGPTENAPSFRPEDVVEGAGRSLLPGLINSHVHLTADGDPDLAGQVTSDTLQRSTLRAAKMASVALHAGTTSVRDCGAADRTAIELGKAIADGLVEGPSVVAAGRVITMTGGHGHFIGREADGPAELRKAVRAELKEGAQFIKVMATGGVLTEGANPSLPSFQEEELAAVIDEAHRGGRRVTTHAIGNAGIANALRAGVDSVEHGIRLDDATLELALDKNAFLVPTLLAVARIVEAGAAGGIAQWILDKAEVEAEYHRAAFVAAVKSGLRIAAGTDAGTPYNLHEDLPAELALMVEYGLSPMAAIVAGTYHAAVNMDIEHRVGSVAVGKRADLILVDGAPDENIADITRLAWVMKDGAIVHTGGDALPR